MQEHLHFVARLNSPTFFTGCHVLKGVHGLGHYLQCFPLRRSLTKKRLIFYPLLQVTLWAGAWSCPKVVLGSAIQTKPPYISGVRFIKRPIMSLHHPQSYAARKLSKFSYLAHHAINPSHLVPWATWGEQRMQPVGGCSFGPQPGGGIFFNSTIMLWPTQTAATAENRNRPVNQAT